MGKTIFIKGLFVIFYLLVFISYSSYAQCYGPTSTGYYTNGKQPAADSNYFVNHVFSTFSSTLGIPTGGALNGNSFAVSTTGLPLTNTIINISPGETPVTGSGFPSAAPQSQNVSTSILGVKVTHAFTSALSAGTHVYLEDVDQKEAWTIVFKDASGIAITTTSFTPFNLSTTALPALSRPTTTSIRFTGPNNNSNSDEPLVGIIIPVSTVKSIEFSVTTSGSASSEIFYSLPLTPSFTATASNNSAICSGSTLTLTGGTSALVSTVPTPVNYIWSGPNSYSNTTTSNTASISSATTSAAGTYSLQVQDAFGCFTTSAVTTSVTINSSPSVNLSSNSPVNYSNTINLSATISGGVTPYTIAWTGPNSFSSSLQNPSISSVSSANAGVYKLQVSGNNGCSTSATTYIAVKSGWIYIHDKSINEESSVDFTFKLKDTANNVLKTFFTNDSAGNTLNVYDLGAGHDDGAGTLWVTAGTSTGTNNTGTVYYRLSGSSNWSSTAVTTATAIDGAGLNKFVYVNNSGDAYYYNAGTSTLIFNHNTIHNGQTASASDIAYGGGKIALRTANGRVYLYTGNYTNDSWTDISGNTNIADRIDMSSDGTAIVYILSATVKKYTIATGTTTTLPAFTTTSGAGPSGTIDMAIDDNGTIYATGNTGNTACCGLTEIVYSYPAGAASWTDEPEARGVKRLTGGPAGQAWGSINIGSSFPQTIYTRVTDNTGIHLWLDDERVKNSSSLYGNSIMMEVDAGTYKVTEILPNATTWDLGRYNLYDPTGNTTGNVSNNTATIRPAYSEVVHVEYINEKLNPKLIDNGNCNTNILQSFDAGSGTGQFGNATYGTPLEGTSYHYFSQTSPQDGYYYIVKSISTSNWFSTPSPAVSDHTGNSGYFLMVNASYAKDEFYRQRITGLTGDLTYRIEFYVANVSLLSPIKPKIRFGMQTLTGTIFGDSTTAEISGSTWQRYSVSFKVPSGITTADLFLRNENIGGLGNDLAIDDIAINPIPTPLITNVISPATSILCVGSTYTISNTVSGGTWSTNNPSAITIDSSTGSITVNSIGAAGITYTYINNAYCKSTATSNVSISVPPTVTVSTSSADVCKDGITTLNANPSSGTAPYSYLWSGSNGTISSLTAANPTLTAPSAGGSYSYSVKVTDNAGCSSPVNTTTVTVHAPSSSIYLFCAPNASPPYARLLETNGPSGYSWLWSATSGSALFYSNSSFADGAATSALQSPYVNRASQYKVVLTDAFGCKDSSTVIFDYTTCTVLSVSLMNFTAAKSDEGVLLNWKTSSETNSKYFLIERSMDEKNWTEIGHVIATGNSNTIKNYFFTDAMPMAGINYYRLKQVDADGKYSLSPTRSVLLSNDWKLKVYPNPVTSGLLQIKSNIKIAALRIMNINGKVLFNSSAASTDIQRINVSDFASGIYFIEVINNKNEVYHSRFMKK